MSKDMTASEADMIRTGGWVKRIRIGHWLSVDGWPRLPRGSSCQTAVP
jgi:hypothetical protein